MRAELILFHHDESHMQSARGKTAQTQFYFYTMMIGDSVLDKSIEIDSDWVVNQISIWNVFRP